MAKPEFKVISIVICDDIRREQNKKHILIGVYSGTIIVGELPAVLPRLFFRISGKVVV